MKATVLFSKTIGLGVTENIIIPVPEWAETLDMSAIEATSVAMVKLDIHAEGRQFNTYTTYTNGHVISSTLAAASVKFGATSIGGAKNIIIVIENDSISAAIWNIILNFKGNGNA